MIVIVLDSEIVGVAEGSNDCELDGVSVFVLELEELSEIELELELVIEGVFVNELDGVLD